MTADIVTAPEDNYPFSVEAKHREGGWTLESIVLDKHDVKNWWGQSVEDAKRTKDKVPALIFTRNYADDFVMLPFHKEFYKDLVENKYPVMSTTVTYELDMTEEKNTYHVLITNLETYKTYDRAYYIDRYLGYDWEEYAKVDNEDSVDVESDTVEELLGKLGSEDNE